MFSINVHKIFIIKNGYFYNVSIFLYWYYTSLIKALDSFKIIKLSKDSTILTIKKTVFFLFSIEG